MKHILQVLKFEYLNCIKNKAFIITTVIIMILILGMSFVPAIILDMKDSETSNDVGNMNIIGIINNAYEDDEIVRNSFEKDYPHSVVQVTKESLEEVKAKVDKSEYTFGVVLNTPISFTYITKNNSIMSEETMYITGAVCCLLSFVLLMFESMEKYNYKEDEEGLGNLVENGRFTEALKEND